MSYILEALQKSEHSRQRGRVPDLNTVAEAGLPIGAGLASPRPPYALAGLVIALAAAALGWWRPWHQNTPPQPEAAQPTTPTPAPAAISPPIALQPPTPNIPSPPPQARPAVTTPSPAPSPSLVTAPASVPRPSAAAPARVETPPPRKADTEPPPPARANAGRILSIQELPSAVRSSLPPLTVSGYAYAGDSDKRMVVVNDRLVQEGDEVAPGVTLTTVTSDGVVFGFQDYRFRLLP